MHPARHTFLSALVGSALLVSASASAAPGLEAAFDHQPSTPAPGQTITFTATTPNATSTPIRHTWDLDNDGQFDDATGDSAQTAFQQAGSYVVRLHAEKPGTAGTIEDTTQRTVLVGAVATPTPTPAPTVTATPIATPPPPGNQPPVATYDRRCEKTGTLTVCAGLLAEESQTVTLSAAPSTDPDGTVVRYEWDLDGDGVFEHDGGSENTIQYAFNRREGLADDMQRTVSLRVTDDDGATDTDTFVIRLTPRACETHAVYRDIEVDALCIKRYWTTDSNNRRVQRHVISGPARVNGIAVVPAVGRTITWDVYRKRTSSGPTLSARPPRLYVGRAKVFMPVDGATVQLWSGKIDWRFANHEIVGFRRDPQARLNGLRIASASPARPQIGPGTARYGVYVQLPEEFGSPTSSSPIELHTGPQAAASASEPLQFTVPGADLGPLGVGSMTVTYDGIDLWTIAAQVGLPEPLQVGVEGDASIRNTGDFVGAGGAATFGSGIPVGGPLPVFLTEIRFRIQIKPNSAKCMPAWAKNAPTPDFELCGGVSLAAGPKVPVFGIRAIGVDGDLGFATYENLPWAFRAWGEMSLVDIPLARGQFYFDGSGYVAAYGEYRYALGDIASLTGWASGEFKKTKFNASAGGRGCFDLIDLCRGYEGVISSKGIAACLSISVALGTWTPGAGMEWGDWPTPYFDGCDIDDYKAVINAGRSAGSALAASNATLRLPAGLPGESIVATGVAGSPDLTIRGPHGERISTTDVTTYVERDGLFIMKNPKYNMTQVLIAEPAAGDWRVEAMPGTLKDLRAAHGLEDPQVKARVLGHGRQRRLVYDIEPLEGQKVTFSERGGGTGGTIGASHGGRGTLRFSPAAGRGGRRDVVAFVEQNGMPREELKVASYHAPAAERPDRPRRLRVARRGSTVRVRWAGQAAAYKVAVTLSDGRRILESTSGHHLTLRRIRGSVRGRVRVEPMSSIGVSGRAAGAAVRKVR